MTKKCKVCNIEFKLTRKDKEYCSKKCYRKIYLKQYRINNKNKIKQLCKDYYQNNKNKVKEYKKQYYEENKEAIAKYKKQYDEENKHKINRKDYHREYYMNKYNNDPEFKIKVNLRNRLNMAIKKELKTGSAIKDLGCSVEELKIQLESQFQEGMTWDNYGVKGWHIDHIKPLASFDLSNPEELKKACNHKNLQPLWAEDNFKKGSTQ